MAKLFLDGIFSNNSDSPSSLKIEQSEVGVSLVGLTTTEPSFSAQNKWGPIINDVSNLQDLASLVGQGNMLSWIGASTMCWKGTSPLSMGIEFYLINYKRGLDLEDNLRKLVRLAALDVVDKAKVKVHGGYVPDILSDNEKYFNGSVTSVSALGDLTDLGNFSQASEGYGKGSITVTFGHKSRIGNLLLSKIDVTESTVEVSDENGGNKKPLYYRVSAQFTGVRPLITTDVDAMFDSIGKGFN